MPSPKPPIPFSEPPYLTGLPSPIHKPTHYAWQKACRKFIITHLPHESVYAWEDDSLIPPHIFQTFAKHNMLLPSLPAPLPVPWLKSLGIHTLLDTVPVEEFDYLHFAIYQDEMARYATLGPSTSLNAGMAFGVPPLIKFGSKALQETFLPDALTGKTRWCIAVTEPDAGSDVAGLTTTATPSEDGKFYLVNGTKKWITTGIWSDYATMAVRTGSPGSGAAGLSLLVVPLQSTPGVSMRRIPVSGGRAAGTTYITLDDVRIPTSNLIGRQGMGMRYIMTNFNHERLLISINAARTSRVALGSAFEYCMQREAFGKTLMEQPVVRQRLARAGALVEMLGSWVDWFVFQMMLLSKDEADVRLGGLTAMLKAKAGEVLNEVAQCAVLLLGGNGYTRTGRGEVVEKIFREVNGARIPGGSEDVMYDLSIRQLVKNFQRLSKVQEQIMELPDGKDSSKL